MYPCAAKDLPTGDPSIPPNAPSDSPRPVARWLTAFLSLLLFTLWTGCSPQSKYEALSFFFDGVPDPNAPPPSSTPTPSQANIIQTASGVTQFIHQPYREDKCQECHATNDPGAIYGTKFNTTHCLTCHDKVMFDEKTVHGPVLAMACLWCHDPHSSTEPHLMKGPSRGVCMKCHEDGTLSTPTPEHLATSKESCLTCHFGHGPGKFLLKPHPAPDLPITPAAPPAPSSSALDANPGMAAPAIR